MQKIENKDLKSLAIGAGIISSGGGGSCDLGLKIAQSMLQQYGPASMISLGDIKPDDIIIPIAYVGAPLVELEKISSGTEFDEMFRQIEKLFGKKPRAIMPAEIGGANALVPFFISQKLGIPVLDADGMGRAFPELQMCSFFYHDLNPTPTFIGNDAGLCVTITSDKPTNIERIARDITISFGSSAAIAIYAMTGAQAAKAVIANSITNAIQIGQVIERATQQQLNVLTELCIHTNAQVVAIGSIVDIKQTVSDGFLKGEVTIQTTDDQEIKILFQNEYLAVIQNSGYLATTPDIVMLVHAHTGLPISTEALTFALSIAIIVLPAPEIWKTPRGLQLVGPQYFGYPTTYKPYQKATS